MFGIGAVNTNDSVSANPTQPLLANQTLTVSGPAGVIGRVGTGTPFTNPVFGGTFLKGNTWQFGYQGIAGLRFDINPLLAFDLDYRYLASTEPTYNNKGVLPFPPFGLFSSAISFNS